MNNFAQETEQGCADLLKKIEIQRVKYLSLFQLAETEVEKELIISNCQNFLYGQLVNNKLPAWYGTKWDFNGITPEPMEGEIACGNLINRIKYWRIN